MKATTIINKKESRKINQANVNAIKKHFTPKELKKVDSQANDVLNSIFEVKKTAPKQKVILSPERKAAIAAKRLANPQFAHLQSKARKLHNVEILKDAKLVLLEAKKTLVNWTLIDGSNQFANEIHLAECKKLINFAAKNESLTALIGRAAKVNKNGLFAVYNFEQVIQKTVKLTQVKKMSYEEALNYIIAAKK